MKKSLEKSQNVLEEKRKIVKRKICIKKTHTFTIIAMNFVQEQFKTTKRRPIIAPAIAVRLLLKTTVMVATIKAIFQMPEAQFETDGALFQQIERIKYLGIMPSWYGWDIDRTNCNIEFRDFPAITPMTTCSKEYKATSIPWSCQSKESNRRPLFDQSNGRETSSRKTMRRF